MFWRQIYCGNGPILFLYLLHICHCPPPSLTTLAQMWIKTFCYFTHELVLSKDFCWKKGWISLLSPFQTYFKQKTLLGTLKNLFSRKPVKHWHFSKSHSFMSFKGTPGLEKPWRIKHGSGCHSPGKRWESGLNLDLGITHQLSGFLVPRWGFREILAHSSLSWRHFSAVRREPGPGFECRLYPNPQWDPILRLPMESKRGIYSFYLTTSI